jgi:hypothetical protein
MCFVGEHVADCREVDTSVGDGPSDFPDGFDLRCRKAEALEFVSSCSPHRIVVKRIKCRKQSCANCGCACG